MASTFTENKTLEMPASGSYSNAWAAPLNAVIDEIDTCLGGTTTISVTGIAAGGYVLTLAQYRPPNIEFTGTISGNLVYAVSAGIGGFWSVLNNTTGAFSLTFGVASSGYTIPQGQRAFLTSDGTNISAADTAQAAAAQAAAQAFATAAANTAQANAEAVAANASNLTSGTVALARLPALPASQITSGTIANARLPNVFAGPGVTIASDPGTTPTGVFGDVFAYY